jgi:hypothetical protein
MPNATDPKHTYPQPIVTSRAHRRCARGCVAAGLCALAACVMAGCATDDAAANAEKQEQSMAGDASGSDSSAGGSAQPPERIRAWMDRLTVPHRYDPATGFIVAERVTDLPPMLAEGPSLDEAVARSASAGDVLFVFATADRCAPCQQFKLDALNDERVIAALAEPGVLATHVEVDREPDAARRHLGSLAIPVTYALRDGVVVDRLPGQRSAADVLAFMDRVRTAG